MLVFSNIWKCLDCKILASKEIDLHASNFWRIRTKCLIRVNNAQDPRVLNLKEAKRFLIFQFDKNRFRKNSQHFCALFPRKNIFCAKYSPHPGGRGVLTYFDNSDSIFSVWIPGLRNFGIHMELGPVPLTRSPEKFQSLALHIKLSKP
jgi:hypothetical protein